MKRLLLHLLLEGKPDALKAILSERALALMGKAGPAQTALVARLRAPIDGPSLTVETVADLYLAGAVLTPSGDDAVGYSVGVKFEGQPQLTWFVIAEKNDYRVLGSADAVPGLAGLAAEALARAARENAVEAKALLEWAKRAAAAQKKSNVPRQVFAALWPGSNRNPAKEFRLGAACLMAEVGSDDALKVLAEERASALSDGLAWDLDRVTAAANAAVGKWQENLALAERLEAARTLHVAEVTAIRVEAMTQLHLWSDLKAFTTRYLEASADELPVVEYAVDAALHAGDGAALEAAVDRMLESVKPSAAILADRARGALLKRGRVDPRALDWAQKANRMETPVPAERQFTLAALYAEAGKTAEAREAFWAALDATDDEASPYAWYLQGRLAETYGLVDAAKKAYQKVAAPAGAAADDPSEMAKRRLIELAGRKK